MRESIVKFFSVPKKDRTEFWQESIRKNTISISVICVIACIAEAYNIFRVLLLSDSGLETLNNRIYFGMYCFLLAGAVVWFLLKPWVCKKSVMTQWKVQYGAILIIFLWHIILNTYDLMRNPDAELFVFITAILGIAVFIQMSSLFSTICFSLAYLLFLVFAVPLMPSGSVVNLTITFIVALFISWTNSYHALVSIQQNKEIIRANHRLQELVQRDSLTGLLNRTAIKLRIEQCLMQARDGSGISFLLLDLDNFKEINDNWGHPCGDYILVESAHKLWSVFPGAAGIGRIGGDEFAVVMDHAIAEEEAESLGRKVLSEFSKIKIQEKVDGIGCSIGICSCGQIDISEEELYEKTDQVLYKAKKEGKGQCCFQKIPF